MSFPNEKYMYASYFVVLLACRYVTVPVTHCNPDETTYEKQCYGGIARDEIDCIIFPDDARDENIAFRNQVYFGQFRYIGE